MLLPCRELIFVYNRLFDPHTTVIAALETKPLRLAAQNGKTCVNVDTVEVCVIAACTNFTSYDT